MIGIHNSSGSRSGQTTLRGLADSIFFRLREDLFSRSSLQASHEELLEVLVGIPTNSNSNQRFLTVEAFRRAGFRVIGMLNEPSAAGLEYAYRYCPTIRQVLASIW